MKLTRLARLFLSLMALGAVAFGWRRYGDDVRCWSNPDACAKAEPAAPPASTRDAGVAPDGPRR